MTHRFVPGDSFQVVQLDGSVPLEIVTSSCRVCHHPSACLVHNDPHNGCYWIWHEDGVPQSWERTAWFAIDGPYNIQAGTPWTRLVIEGPKTL